MVKIGDKIPIHIPQIEDKNCILFFYPKDDTPGCTREACGFRDISCNLLAKGVHIIGISCDNEASHQKFKNKYNLNFELLADTEKEIAKAFDVLKEKVLFGIKKTGIERSTFIINAEGFVIWMEKNVSLLGHIERVCTAIDTLL